MPAATSCKVLVLVGLPASGKSTWAHKRRLPVLSSDHVRLLLADDETDQSIHKQVFALVRRLLRLRLDLNRPVTVIDATSLTPKERRPYIKIACDRGAAIEAVYFATPLDVCLARNRRRSRKVPLSAMLAMQRKLVAPTLAEGFSRVQVIRPPKRNGKR